jgi:hypothetical protein
VGVLTGVGQTTHLTRYVIETASAATDLVLLPPMDFSIVLDHVENGTGKIRSEMIVARLP